MTPWLLLLLSALPLLCFSQVTVTKRSGFLDYEFKIDKFLVEDEEVDHKKFQKISLQGVVDYEGVYHKKGEPELPVIRFYVNAPGEITVTKSDLEEDSNSIRIRDMLRASDSVPKIAGARKEIPALVDSTLDFETDYEIKTVGSSRGVMKRLVTLYPVHWDKTSGIVKKISSFKVSVPLGEERRDSESPLMVFVVAERFQNSDELERLIEYKKKRGFSTQVLIVSTQGKYPELIRNELKQIYRENSDTLSYVLLVGSARLLPGYQSKRLSGVTDHYYRCLDIDDYESDIGTPDVFLGRLSVKYEEELEAQVTKIIEYETRAHESEWQTKASFITTNDKLHWQIAEDSSNYTIRKYTEGRGYTGSFPQYGSLGGDKLFAVSHKASGKDVISSINEGRGFIQYSGHGISSAWEFPRVTIADVARIQDTGARPLVIANSCSTAKITALDSIAESWMRHKYGAIAYWGAMDVAYWDEDVVMQKKMSDELFGNGNHELGSFTNEALSDVWRYYGGVGESKYYWELYLTLGDPSLRVSIK